MGLGGLGQTAWPELRRRALAWAPFGAEAGLLRRPREPLAVSSGQQFGLKTDSRQWALGSKKANTRKQLAKIRQQHAVRNQPLRLGFLNSDLPTAYCLLPTSLPTMSLSMVEGLGGKAAVIEGTDVTGTQAKQVKTELDACPTRICRTIN